MSSWSPANCSVSNMKQMIQPPDSFNAGSYTPPSPVPAPTGGGGIDLVKLKQYLHIIVRRIWIVAICFVVALVISVIQVSKQQATFRASTSLLLTRGTQLPGISMNRDVNIFGDFMDTQVRIINSLSVMKRARDNMNMPEAEISRMNPKVTVWPVGKSAVIAITVESLDANFSADYANQIARSYVSFKDDERLAGSQTTSINLMQQANKIRDELRKAEEALILFKKENSIVLTEREGNIPASIMSDLSRRTASHRMERMILELQRPLLAEASDDVVLTALSSRYVPMSPVVTLPDAAAATAAAPATPEGAAMTVSPRAGAVDFNQSGSDEWQTLRKRKNILEHELRLARENLRDSHPSIRKLMHEIRQVDAAIEREVQHATEKYYNELEALTLMESSLERVRGMWMAEAMETELVLDRYKTLQNDVNRLRNMLDAVFARIREVDISSGIIPDNVTIVEEAVPRNVPVTPRKLQSIFLAGLIGIGIGIGIIFGIDFLDDSIRYPEEVGKSLNLRFLGIIPTANWSTADIRTHLLSQLDPKSGLAEAYRNIRSTLLLDDQSRKVRTMLMTSAVPKEGKTTTSLNISISLAQAGLRVLLVDADMRRGELHKYFGLEGGRGLADVLSGQAKAESVIQRTGVPNLDLVATGPFPANPSELMLRQEFRTFLDYAKRSYDKIIFDGPPVMAVSEAGVLSSIVDTTIMVVWAGKTSRKVCQITTQNLQQRGARIDGCILNNLEFGRVGYYYYSTYYGYYTYDYRYDEASKKA